MSDIEQLTAAIREFARERDWERFHTPKNLAMALSPPRTARCPIISPEKNRSRIE